MVQFSIARTNEALENAIELVKSVYIEEGYIDSERGETTSISAYLGKEGATTMLAHHNDELLGTISVVSDTHGGVPMDSIYKEELSAFRAKGARIAEVCQFAINKSAWRNNDLKIQKLVELDVTVGLLGLAVQYGLASAHDYLCFAINPKHRVFYESLGCMQIGEEKSYGSVNEAPALAYVLDMHAVRQAKASEEKKHFLLTKIFDTELPENFFV